MSKRHRKLRPAKKGELAMWANAGPHEKERLRLIELRMRGYISEKDYREDMAAVDRAEREAASR